MNRREAIAALVAMPEVTKASILRTPKPTDVIVLETADHTFMSNETRQRIQEMMQSVWPNQRVVVLPPGTTLKVVSDG